jgi:hypothetical protein
MAWAVSAAAAIITAGTGVATAIAGTHDARKREFYLQNLAALDFEQKKKLNDDLIKANSEQARQEILASTLGNIGGKRVETLGALAIEKEKTNKIVTIVGLGTGVLLLGGVIYSLTKDNK